MNLSDIEKRCEAAMDYSKAIDSIARTLQVLGEPLSEAQRLGMAGSVAVWMEKAYQQALQDAQVQDLQSKLTTAEGLVALQQEQIGGMQRKVGELEAVVQKVVKWNADYPSHRIYGETSIRRIAAEMDAINAEAMAALNTETTG